MDSPIDLSDPIALLLAAADALHGAGIPAAAYGGLALAIYGEPRETRDADLAVVGTSATQGMEAMVRAGFTATVAFDRVGFGGLWVSRVTLVGGGELNTVDLVEPRSERYARDVLARAVSGRLRERELVVVAPEDFVILKVLSSRDRDLEDAVSVLASLGGELDVGLIDREVAELATELATHDVTGRWARVVAPT
jgi:hypothetical protein